MIDGVSCETCPYFTPPRGSSSADANVQASGLTSVFTHGVCRRFPTTVQKRADDWCAEHPTVFEKDATITTLDAIAVEVRRVGDIAQQSLEALQTQITLKSASGVQTKPRGR